LLDTNRGGEEITVGVPETPSKEIIGPVSVWEEEQGKVHKSERVRERGSKLVAA